MALVLSQSQLPRLQDEYASIPVNCPFDVLGGSEMLFERLSHHGQFHYGIRIKNLSSSQITGCVNGVNSPIGEYYRHSLLLATPGTENLRHLSLFDPVNISLHESIDNGLSEAPIRTDQRVLFLSARIDRIHYSAGDGIDHGHASDCHFHFPRVVSEASLVSN